MKPLRPYYSAENVDKVLDAATPDELKIISGCDDAGVRMFESIAARVIQVLVRPGQAERRRSPTLRPHWHWPDYKCPGQSDFEFETISLRRAMDLGLPQCAACWKHARAWRA